MSGRYYRRFRWKVREWSFRDLSPTLLCEVQEDDGTKRSQTSTVVLV